MSAVAPIGANPSRIEKLCDEALRVVEVIHAVHPTSGEVVERIGELTCAHDPWEALDKRRAITNVAARMLATANLLFGMLGNNALTLADDRNELAAGIVERAERGAIEAPAPRKRRRRQGGRS